MSTTKKVTVKEIIGRLVGVPEVTIVDGNVRSVSFITIEEREDGGPGPQRAYTIEQGAAYSNTMNILTEKGPTLRERFCVDYVKNGAKCVFKSWEKREISSHLRGGSFDGDPKEYSEHVAVEEADEDKVIGEDIPF